LNKVVHLIRVIARYSITVRELKQLLNLAKPKQTLLLLGNEISVEELLGANYDCGDDGDCPESQKLATRKVLRLIHHILEFQAEAAQGKPLGTFNFNGRTSQFVLGSLPQWPPSGSNPSWSFSTWIRSESFSSQPRLLSFFTAENYGFELYFEEGMLHYDIRSPAAVGSEPPLLQNHKFDFPFAPKTWYHLALTFSSSSRIWGKSSEIRLYVNGILRQKIEILGQVQVFKNLEAGRIGCGSSRSLSLEKEKSGDPPEKTEAGDAALEKFTFFGEMSAIYFFEGELLPKEISEIFSLGPAYSSDFAPNSTQGLFFLSV
jgi:hypothetical protein